ncbi:MAG: hypothetical protein ACYCV0_10235 [Desulfitobacteriaceae bacterium]
MSAVDEALSRATVHFRYYPKVWRGSRVDKRTAPARGERARKLAEYFKIKETQNEGLAREARGVDKREGGMIFGSNNI